eukprot:g4341.t1
MKVFWLVFVFWTTLLLGLSSALFQLYSASEDPQAEFRYGEENEDLDPFYSCRWCPDVIGLGNQKTGTTAIAHAMNFLLQEVGGWEQGDISLLIDPAEVDFIRAHPVAHHQRHGDQSLKMNIKQHLTILKVPSILPHLRRFRHACPQARFYGVVRAPLQNARSLMDRLAHLGGDAQKTTMAGTLMTLRLHDLRPDLFQRYIAKTDLNEQVDVLNEAWAAGVFDQELEPELLRSVGIDPERLAKLRANSEVEERGKKQKVDHELAEREHDHEQEEQGKLSSYLAVHQTDEKKAQVELMEQYDLRDVQLRFDLEHRGRQLWEGLVKKFARRHLAVGTDGPLSCSLWRDLFVNVEHETWRSIVNETRAQIDWVRQGWRKAVLSLRSDFSNDGHLEVPRPSARSNSSAPAPPVYACLSGLAARWVDFVAPFVQVAHGADEQENKLHLRAEERESAAVEIPGETQQQQAGSLYAQSARRSSAQVKKKSTSLAGATARDEDKNLSEAQSRNRPGGGVQEQDTRRSTRWRLRDNVKLLNVEDQQQTFKHTTQETQRGAQSSVSDTDEREDEHPQHLQKDIFVLRYEDFRGRPAESTAALVNALGLATIDVAEAVKSASFQHAARIQLQPRGWGHGKALADIFSAEDCRELFSSFLGKELVRPLARLFGYESGADSLPQTSDNAPLGSALAEQAAPELLQLEQPVPLSHIHTYVQAGASSIGLSSDNRPVLNLGLSFKLPINELFDAICR